MDYVLFSDSTVKPATNAQQWYVTISRGRLAGLAVAGWHLALLDAGQEMRDVTRKFLSRDHADDWRKRVLLVEKTITASAKHPCEHFEF